MKRKKQKFAVYMIQSGDAVKVGFSSNIPNRMKTMQTGSPVLLQLIAKFPCGSKADALELERVLHETLEPCRIRGEWFNHKQLKKLLRPKVGNKTIGLKGGFHAKLDAANAVRKVPTVAAGNI